MMCRDCLDEQREPRGEEGGGGRAAAAVRSNGRSDKTRSKEEGVREGVVVGKKCEVTGEVGKMEEREEKALSLSVSTLKRQVPTHRPGTDRWAGRQGRQTRTIERERGEMQSARVLAGLDWAGTGGPARVPRWVRGLLAVAQRQRAADGLEELTGCCDWRGDGGPEPGACPVKGAGSAFSLALLPCTVSRVYLRALPAPGGVVVGSQLIDSGLNSTQ